MQKEEEEKKSAFSFSFGTIITLSLMAFLGPSFAFSFYFLSLILCLWCRGMHVKKRREVKRWEQEIARNFRGSICGCGSPAVMQMQIPVSSLFLSDSLPPSPPLSLAMRLIAYDMMWYFPSISGAQRKEQSKRRWKEGGRQEAKREGWKDGRKEGVLDGWKGLFEKESDSQHIRICTRQNTNK